MKDIEVLRMAVRMLDSLGGYDRRFKMDRKTDYQRDLNYVSRVLRELTDKGEED